MEAMLLWGLCLLAVAVLILVVDVFLPSAGLLALLALALAIAGDVCLFRYDTVWGLIGMIVTVLGGPVLMFLGLNVMPNTPIGRMLVLNSTKPQDEEDRTGGATAPGAAIGSSGGAGGTSTSAGPSRNELDALIGKEGTVLTDLRPIGTIRIGDKRYDALSDTGMVRAGATVRVSSVEGSQIKVRPLA